MRDDFDDFPSNHTYGRVVKKKSSFQKKTLLSFMTFDFFLVKTRLS